MSLLEREDFVLYHLRTSYLSMIKDGVGDRLIHVDASVLNDPAFRAAGWFANPSDIRRTYSPPIPTAVTAEYFQAPRNVNLVDPGFGDDEEEGGMITGAGPSADTVGPGMQTRRKRRKETQPEEEDSSDLSEESDEEGEGTQRPGNQIKFQKMPLRTRAGSSPIRSSNLLDGPSVLVTSPSHPADGSRLRRGSLGAVEVVKERARRDTTTSSEMSSENELDPSVFQRKQVNPLRAAKAGRLLAERIQEDDREDLHDMDPGEESDSTLSSGFDGSEDSESILDAVDSGPLTSLPSRPSGETAMAKLTTSSPKRSRQGPSVLQALPPPRPISVMAPVSALTLALKAKDKKPDVPFERFAILSGKGDPNPIYIKVFAPFAKPTRSYEVLLRRSPDSGGAVSVAEAIGLALWRYFEEKIEPPIPNDKFNVNRWNFRMVEDDEVDYDFPALSRVRPMADFTSNNNNPRLRGRSRDKPWDEFALVEANDSEFRDNQTATPQYAGDTTAVRRVSSPPPTLSKTPVPQAPASVASVVPVLPRNPIIGPTFSVAAFRSPAAPLLDAPVAPVSHATPRMGPPKTLTVHFTDNNFVSIKTQVEVTTDTYIAEVFDQVCKRLKVDMAAHVLKVSNSATVAPSDRTVEALGDRSELDLVRRRFIGDGNFGLSGSPGSSSPNAPLLIAPGGTPKKGKKVGTHPLAQRNDALMLFGSNSTYKRYYVVQKKQMSFSSSTAKIMALEGEYMHVMPTSSEHHPTATKFFETPGKVMTVHFSSVIGTKVSRRHPRMFRVVVYREREQKRYDFETQTSDEAQEIVSEIKKGVARFHEGAA
ncbi:hypothetical protein EJ06DRAFT_548608 [Trichodelitschia bisporula]|uniref:SIN1-domain-containing protein n=1 Tax=Trichodelitschia bisporula TaxID=703511 RepID=A0A6G1HX08_9PEZI|nr:hypothetical protein EJ06DRAFT_548608 [Trichodelitschia bisporula]